jgi:hypothetical protein
MKSNQTYLKFQKSKRHGYWIVVELSTGCYKNSEILPFGPPSSTWGRWAKISPLFTPLWITRASHCSIPFSIASIGDPDDDYLGREHHQGGPPMETLNQLFARMLVFIYHCFDRVVVNGYLSMLSRPENVVYFFRQVVGIPRITKEVLMQRTQQYQTWVQAYALNHDIPIQWAEKRVRKEDQVAPFLKRMERQNRYGVYFIYKSMEQGSTFRCSSPKFPTKDPNYTLLSKTRSRFTHYYFYLRDPKLGPMILRVASFLPFQATYYINGHSFLEAELNRTGISFQKKDNAFLAIDDPQALQEASDRLTPELLQERFDYWTFVLGPKFSKRERKLMNLDRFYAFCQVEYCLNFIFRKTFPIHKLFERSCELGLLELTAEKISQIFGQRITRQLKGKLHTTLERIDHGHHVLRAYFKHGFVKQYEKFQTFLRIELCNNNLKDFFLKKGIQHLAAVRTHFLPIIDRFASFEAQALQVHVDFPFFQPLALPIVSGHTKIPGIKIHDTRIVRLMEVLMHSGASISSWQTDPLHQTLLKTFDLQSHSYTLTQLRYDLRKMKAHGLVQRDPHHYCYRLTKKGIKVSLLFLLFHKRICGPIANSLFHFRPSLNGHPKNKLEEAYQKTDKAVQHIIELLAA